MAIWEIALNRSRREIKKSLLVGSSFLPQNGEGAVSGRNNLDTYQMPPPPPPLSISSFFFSTPSFPGRRRKEKGTKKCLAGKTQKKKQERMKLERRKGKRVFLLLLLSSHTLLPMQPEFLDSTLTFPGKKVKRYF